MGTKYEILNAVSSQLHVAENIFHVLRGKSPSYFRGHLLLRFLSKTSSLRGNNAIKSLHLLHSHPLHRRKAGKQEALQY